MPLVRRRVNRQMTQTADAGPGDARPGAAGGSFCEVGDDGKYGHGRIWDGELDDGRTDLREADLRGANLSGANLNIADLRGADLCGANLSGTLLRNAILSEAVHLTAGQVQSGTDWRHAHLPEDLQYLKPARLTNV